MFTKLLLSIFLCSPVTLGLSAINCQDMQSDKQLDNIVSELKQSINLKDESLFITAREDLSNDLIDLQYILKTRNGSKLSILPIEIFEIRREGYKVQDGVIQEAAVDLDDAPTWRVAYNSRTKDSFHLYGFPDSQMGFNSLVSQLGITVNEKSHAQVVQSTFVKLTYLDSIHAEVRDELQLMRAAINDYDRHPRSAKAFSAFWNKCPYKVKRRIASPVVSKLADGFAVAFFTDTDRTVSKTIITLSPDGQIRSAESKKLFVWPRK